EVPQRLASGQYTVLPEQQTVEVVAHDERVWPAAGASSRADRQLWTTRAQNDAPWRCHGASRLAVGSGGGADPKAATALDGAPLFLAHPAPDAGVLTAVEGPPHALVGSRTTPADRLRLLDLQQGRAGRPDREEQLRVLIAAGSMVAPVRHGGNTP